MALPGVAIAMYCMTFVTLPSNPPAIIPVVPSEQAPVSVVAAVRSPKSVALPGVEMVT